MEIKDEVLRKALEAKAQSLNLANAGYNKRKEALLRIGEELRGKRGEIIFKNEIDVEAASETGLSSAFIDRLTLDEKRIDAMISGCAEIAGSPDVLWQVIAEVKRPSGIHLKKVRVPLGVVGVIYESRPNVTVDTSALCIMSGNCAVLKGGKEAVNTNTALVSIIHSALSKTAVSPACVQFVEFTSREAVQALLSLYGIVDVIIPRGGSGMIREIVEKSLVPVIAHGPGICHTYVSASADIGMAVRVAVNAKVSRPSTCNAMETLLVHRDIAAKFLPEIRKEFDRHQVEIRGCERTAAILPSIKPASEEDWKTEYLDLIISIRVVDNTEQAIRHIQKYGTGHSEAIITQDNAEKEEFFSWVDAACVYHNASTRFTDGGEFGLGAEIGISTQKIHARGPMGMAELTSYKWLVEGQGNIRE